MLLIKSQLPRTFIRLNSTRSLLDISTKLVKDPNLNNKDADFISHPMFPHPNMTLQECEKVEFEHREPVTFSDKVALKGLRTIRKTFDFFTGYKKPEYPGQYEGTRFNMTENKWVTRCIFLESIAGVPGMTAAFLRHLHSMRLLKRDKAWVETLLDEAYNERIHLLTFIKLGQPSWFTKLFIFVGQGVFCNIFFFNYLFFPKVCHRFVGYLEEEAVSTYTHFLHELDEGKLKKFDEMAIPEVAVEYFKNLDKNSTIKDLILTIRADEAKHREVNHTLANLNQKTDRNPFALEIENVDQPQPRNDLKTHKGKGWERENLIL